LVEFANALQTLLDVAIVLERLTNLRNLIGPQADLAILSAGITHGEDPERMALAAGALGTTRGVMDGALEQRSAEDVRGGGKLGGELLSFADGLLSCHR
jgi:hypothetical protein